MNKFALLSMVLSTSISLSAAAERSGEKPCKCLLKANKMYLRSDLNHSKQNRYFINSISSMNHSGMPVDLAHYLYFLEESETLDTGNR